MHIDDNFTEVVVKATGEKTHVPPHWMDDPVLSRPFELPPSVRAAQAADQGAPVDPPADPPVDPPADDTPTQTPDATPTSDKNPGRRG